MIFCAKEFLVRHGSIYILKKRNKRKEKKEIDQENLEAKDWGLELIEIMTLFRLGGLKHTFINFPTCFVLPERPNFVVAQP